LSNGLVSKGGDHPLEAALSKADGSYAQAFPAYPHASAAENAFVGVIYENGTAGIYRKFPFQPPEPFCLQLDAQVSSYFLKLTPSVRCAMGTVNRVASQK
jgi:hypothetical protein